MSEPVLNLHNRLRHVHEDYDKGIDGVGKRCARSIGLGDGLWGAGKLDVTDLLTNPLPVREESREVTFQFVLQ